MIFKSQNTNLNFKNAVGFLTFKKFESFDFFKCAFSTRLGGISQSEFKSMNFSFNKGDKSENVLENYRIFCSAADFDFSKLALSKQEHTDIVKIVTEKDTWNFQIPKENRPPVDALITNERGLTLATFFADCVPIIILDPINRAFGTAHAGWKGTVLEISKKIIKVMQKNYDSKPENLICLIGPSIHKCCFEVDKNCILKFKNSEIKSVEKYIFKKENKKYNVDLQGINKQILLNCGIKEENIEISDLCTKCNHDLLFSHRKFGEKRGTMAVFCQIAN